LTIAANRIIAAASKALSDGVRDGLAEVSIVFLLSFDGRDKHGSVEQCLCACGHCCQFILDPPARDPRHGRVEVHIIRRIFLHGNTRRWWKRALASTSTRH
jgi:hypothetical protein